MRPRRPLQMTSTRNSGNCICRGPNCPHGGRVRHHGSRGQVKRFERRRQCQLYRERGCTSGQDFDTSGTLTWADGETGPKNIVVDYFEDTAIEGQESFRIALNTPTGGAAIHSSENFKVMIIVDNDEGFRLRATAASVHENVGTVQILLREVVRQMCGERRLFDGR